MANKVLDARGKKCPIPISMIALEIKNIPSGQTLEVLANDPAFGKDVESYCRVSGNRLIGLDKTGEEFKAVITKA